MCVPFIATRANDHKFGGFKTTQMHSFISVGKKSDTALPGLCSFLEAPGQNPFLCFFQLLEALTLLCSNPASPGSFLRGRYLLLILSHLPLQLLRTLVIRLDPPRKSRTSFPSQGPQLNHINESDVTDSQLQGLGNRHLLRTVSLSTTHWKGRRKKKNPQTAIHHTVEKLCF